MCILEREGLIREDLDGAGGRKSRPTDCIFLVVKHFEQSLSLQVVAETLSRLDAQKTRCSFRAFSRERLVILFTYFVLF